MKRGLSFLLAMIVVFCTLSSVTATVYADYDANLIAHQKMDNILQNYVDPNYHLDNYTFTETEEAELRAVAKNAIAGCSTDYEKIAAVTRFVAENIYYDYDYYEDRTDLVYTQPYDVWTSKRTVCAGYARLTKALLNFINVPCMYVLADNHAYNAAYDSDNNRWIYLDATWCSGNVYRYGKFINGSYDSSEFDMSLETLSRLSNHEFYSLSGIFVDAVEYRLITPNSKDNWANLDEWYLEINEVKDDYIVGDLDYSGISLYDIPLGSVADWAFYNCTSLTSIELPDSVTWIGYSAFSGCTKLKSIKIPNSVTSIGYSAFYNCESLTSVIIPDSVTSIDGAAFASCESLASVTISDSLTSIGDSTFSSCESLTSISIPNSVKSIGDSAFYNCTSLKSATIGNGVTSIGERAFNNCTSLTSATIGNGVTSIGERAFYNCTSLKSIKVPDSVTSIGDSAFNNCTSLTSVTIGNGVKSIGISAFGGCSNLTSVYITDIASWCGISFGDEYYSNPLYFADKLYVNGKLATDVVVPDGVTKISPYCFSCDSLTSITIPDSVTTIGYSAFDDCISLTSVKIGNSVTTIGSAAFDNCTSLNSINIPNGVTSIDSFTFRNCTSLTSLKIPDSVKTIGQNAFTNCTSLSSVTIGKGVTCIEGHVFENCTNLKTITIPNNVVEIWSNVFEGCTSLTTVNLSEGLEYIGRQAFDGCINLSKINLPDSITFIGDGVFADCTSIESIVLPEGINTIDFRSFYNCSSLTSVTIPVSVTSIGSSAFYGSNIKNIFYLGNSTQWNKIEIEGYNYPINSAKIHYNATGHTSSAWIIDEKATANNEGKKHKECTQCGEILKTATIKQLKCSKPVLKKVYNANSYVKVTWGAVNGADLYRVYRKTGTGSYEYIGSTSKTYFNDKEAGAGKTCRYIVKAKNEAGYSEYSLSMSIKHIDEPTLKSIENSAYGVLIKWDKVTGAEKYNVYRKVSGGEYEYIGATSNTYYTDKTAKSGTKYYYAIRAKRDDSVSSQSASRSKYYLADPTLNTPTSTTSGIKLSWSKVMGAEGYMVYRKTGSGSYTKLATVKGSTKVTYTDSSAKKGKKYTYKIKAYKSSTYSAYSNTKTITDKY